MYFYTFNKRYFNTGALRRIVNTMGRMHETSLNFGGLTETIVLDKRSFSENIGLNLVVCTKLV